MADKKTQKIIIIEDTREQRPFTRFPDFVKVERMTLSSGDYSLKGYEQSFAVERKSIDDFCGTMINGFEGNTQKPRKRFNNELERLRHYDVACIVVVADWSQLIEYEHNCGMYAHGALWQFALSLFATYGIPVFALPNETLAAKFVADLARHYLKVREKKNRTAEDLKKRE